MSDIDDFRTDLTNTLIKELKDTRYGLLVSPWQVKKLINAITKGWAVERDMNYLRDAQGFVQNGADLRTDPGPESKQVPLTMFRMSFVREQTADEREEQAAIVNRVTELANWKYGDKPYKAAPPVDVSILDLLEQGRWWVTRKKVALRIRDMDWDHRYNVLRILRNKAVQLNLAYCSSHIWHDAPIEVVNGLDAMDPHEWIEARPLVRKLVKSLER